MDVITPTSALADDRLDPALRKLTWILIVGGLAPLLDTTVVNVALATLGRDLHASLSMIQWVVTGYLLALAVVIPVTGWAGRRFGGKQVWLFSLIVFLAGSVLSGSAWNAGSLIVFRVIQGVGGGLMQPVLMTILIQAAGQRRLGRLMATASAPLVVVPIFGPVIGGLIVSNLGWRWIFYLNAPVCLAAMALAWRGVPSTPAAREPRGRHHPFDLVGLALLSPALASILYGLSQVASKDGFGSASVVVPTGTGILLSAAFTIHALRAHQAPLIDLRLFHVRSFSAAVGVLFLAGLSLYGPLLVLALYYQQVRGQSPIATGLLLAPQGIGSLLPRIWVGNLTDRAGPRPVVVAGIVLTALGTLVFTNAALSTNELLLAASLLVRGAGLGSATIAVMAGAFEGLRREQVPDANSTLRIVQQVGGSFGAAVLAVILERQVAPVARADAASLGIAFGATFWWSVGLAVLAMGPALLLAPLRPRDRSELHQTSQVHGEPARERDVGADPGQNREDTVEVR